jgi:hypothetical protein
LSFIRSWVYNLETITDITSGWWGRGQKTYAQTQQEYIPVASVGQNFMSSIYFIAHVTSITIQ